MGQVGEPRFYSERTHDAQTRPTAETNSRPIEDPSRSQLRAPNRSHPRGRRCTAVSARAVTIMASNSLGLDISESTTTAEAPVAEPAAEAGATEDASAASDAPQSPQTETKKKEAPYVNPERVKTGGAARVRGALFRIVYGTLTFPTFDRTSPLKMNSRRVWRVYANRTRRSSNDEL